MKFSNIKQTRKNINLLNKSKPLHQWYLTLIPKLITSCKGSVSVLKYTIFTQYIYCDGLTSKKLKLIANTYNIDDINTTTDTVIAITP